MIRIPNENKKLIQTNRSNILGNTWSSFNLDTESNLGATRISPRFIINTSASVSDSDIGCPVAFRFFDGAIWAICGAKIFGNSGVTHGNFTEDSSTDAQTDYSADESDMELFNASLCTTTTDALYSKVSNGSGAGAWTPRDVLNTGTPHVMTYYKVTDRLYYSDLSDNIISINTSWATADPGATYAISLSSNSNAYTILCMKASSSRIWIGVLDRLNEAGGGKILEWDGVSNQVTNEYKLNAQGCLAITVDPITDSVIAMDSNGVLLKYNGAGFSEVGRLPITTKLLQKINDVDNERFIHPNGLIFTRDGTVLAFVNNLNSDSTVNEHFNAGIYEFSLDGNCVHRSSLSYYTNLTGVTDYGQNRLSRVGALFHSNIYSTSASRNGTMLAGATFYRNSSTTDNAIFYDDSNDSIQKYGYFVTTWISASAIKDSWQRIIARYRKLLNSGDKIVFKYRTTEIDPSSDITITWYNNENTFKTSTSLSSWAVGDEVEVVQGPGSGKCAHITTMNDLGGGVTEVVLDETFDGVVSTDTAKIRLQKWVKIGSISDQTSESKKFDLAVSSERIQLKICMQFTGKDELFDVNIINQPKEPMA